jgi:hypothetical protein
LKTRDFSNMGLATKMLSKGKLEIMPSRVKGASEVKKIFSNTKSAAGTNVSGAVKAEVKH